MFALTLKHAYLFASLVHTLHSWPNNGMKKKKNLRSLAAVKTRIHPTTAYQHPPTFKLFNFQGLRHWQTVRHATESIIIRIDWWPSAVNQSWLHETYLGSQVPEKGTVIGISALNLSSTHPHVSKADSFKTIEPRDWQTVRLATETKEFGK